MEEIYLNPIERKEFFLAKLGGQEVTPPDAVTRIERYLQDIIDGNASTIPPVTRIEYYLAKISGADVAVPDPVTRTEYYLAKIAGMDVDPPDPITRLDYFLAQWVETGGGVLETVTGNAPIVLVDALAKAIHSLIQYGLCDQASTPTPSAPVDIKCNNGALKMVDDELPDGYKRVLGFTCNNNAMWQITGFKLKGSDTVRIGFSVTAACNVFGCYQGTDATDNYDLYVSTTSGSKYLRYGNGTYLSYWSAANLDQRFDVVFTPTGTTGMPQDSTWTEMTFESANDLLIGSTTTTGTSSKLKGNLYGDFIVDGRLHLVPCERISDNVLGYYDLVGEVFYEPYTGFDGAVSLGYDGSHYVLRTVGTPEVLTVGGKNLNAGTLDSVGYTSTGAESTSSTFVGTLCKIPCAEGEKYTVSFGGFTTSGISGVFINTWKTDGAFNSRQAIASSGETTYTIPTGVGMVNFTLYKTGGATIDDEAWMQVELGASATPYEPYIAPQTASVQNLLSVGDYADTQEVISGLVNRNVGIAIFDGTEGWTRISDTRYQLNFPAAVPNSVCRSTHFAYSTSTSGAGKIRIASSGYLQVVVEATTLDGFKGWLGNQYAYGNPVIVMYALATPTTESVEAQPLNASVGTNEVSVTAEVSPVALEAVYTKAAA